MTVAPICTERLWLSAARPRSVISQNQCFISEVESYELVIHVSKKMVVQPLTIARGPTWTTLEMLEKSRVLGPSAFCWALGFLPQLSASVHVWHIHLRMSVTQGRSPTLILCQFTALQRGWLLVPCSRVVLKLKYALVYKIPRTGHTLLCVLLFILVTPSNFYHICMWSSCLIVFLWDYSSKSGISFVDAFLYLC